jgi:pimeloyl-ACP methyl ester carboxylesterase
VRALRRAGVAAIATAVVALGLAASGDGKPAAASRPALRNCDVGLPKPFKCGRIVVPMRRADPSLGTTEVAFAVRFHTDRKRPPLGAIVAMDGGPGYASSAPPFARSVYAVLAPLLDRRDLVIFDERGTGRSDVVNCPGLQLGLIQESIAVAECANQLGPSFAGYTSAEAAYDLEAVRQALGYGKVTYYGDSYGTLFGQAYAARFPDSLRGLILDSAYPANDPYYRTLLPAGLRGLRVTCRLAPACSGDPVARYTRVVRRFHAAHRSTEGLISILLQAGTFAPRSYLNLDAAVRLFLAGKPRRLNTIIAPGEAGQGPVKEFSYGLEITVECNDYPLLWDPTAPIVERIAQLDASVQKMPKDFFAPFGRREYLLSHAAHLTNCLTWPAPPPGGTEPPWPPGHVAPTSFPTLVLAGQVDDITSVPEAKEVTKRFPRSRLYIVPNRGHASSLYYPFRSPAVGVIRRFIAAN